MATKLYVGKLAYATTEDTLRKVCEEHGPVTSVQIIMDRDTNQSKGFGFVEMENDADAQAVIKALDGQEIDGRAVVVNIARPKEDRPAGGNRY